MAKLANAGVCKTSIRGFESRRYLHFQASMGQFLFNSVVHLKYVAIFLGTFIEGPIVGLFVGLLSKIDQIDIVWGYLAHVFGDLSADMVYFSLGYFGGKKLLPKIAKWLHFDAHESEAAKTMLLRHSYKIIIFGKISHVFGFPILIGVGLARFSPLEFLFLDFIATLIKSALLVALGYFFGYLWKSAEHILMVISIVATIFLLGFILYYVIRRYEKKAITKNKV